MNSQTHHLDQISFKALSVGIGLGELRSSKAPETSGQRLHASIVDSSHIARDILAANSLADRAADFQGQFVRSRQTVAKAAPTTHKPSQVLTGNQRNQVPIPSPDANPVASTYLQDRLKGRTSSRVVHQMPNGSLSHELHTNEVETVIGRQARRWENRILAFTIDFMMVLLCLIVAGVFASLLSLYKSGAGFTQLLQGSGTLSQWQEFPVVKLLAHTNPLYVLAAVYGAVFLYVVLFKVMRGRTLGQAVIYRSIYRDVIRRKFHVA